MYRWLRRGQRYPQMWTCPCGQAGDRVDNRLYRHDEDVDNAVDEQGLTVYGEGVINHICGAACGCVGDAVDGLGSLSTMVHMSLLFFQEKTEHCPQQCPKTPGATRRAKPHGMGIRHQHLHHRRAVIPTIHSPMTICYDFSFSY